MVGVTTFEKFNFRTIFSRLFLKRRVNGTIFNTLWLLFAMTTLTLKHRVFATLPLTLTDSRITVNNRAADDNDIFAIRKCMNESSNVIYFFFHFDSFPTLWPTVPGLHLS